MRGNSTPGATQMLLATLGMLVLAIAAGCRSNTPNAVIPSGRVDTPEASAKKVAAAGYAIVSACAKEPFSNASQGLIAAEPGLHEDVLDLRDRATYRAVPFGLSETERLQELLLKESTAATHPAYPAEQASCIQQFADHLQSLTEPLIQADQVQKQLDVSAFDKASKEAAQQTEDQTEQEEKAIHPTQSANP